MSRTRSTPRALPFDALTVPLDPGVTLVEASAGTGKTFAITRLVLRLLLERRVENLSRILVVTFTEKATQELVTRIRTTLRDAERVWSASPPERNAANADLFTLKDRHGDAGRDVVLRALGALDDLAVSTIHGFCQRILSESALESRIPFRTTFIEDDTEPFGRAARDWARQRLLFNEADATRVVADGGDLDQWVKALVAPFRRRARTALAYDASQPEQALLRDFIETVDEAFESEKRRRHLLGFDDLLLKLSRVLVDEGAQGALAQRIRTRFGAALIDEFQDTDQSQFPIFSNAFAGCPLWIIGDPKQSIYDFRGADIDAYLEAARSAGRTYTLLENYRSTPAYVKAVETLFTRASDPFLVSDDAIDYPRVTAAQSPVPPGGLATDGRSAMEWWWVDGSLGKKKTTVAKDDALAFLVRDVTNEIVRLHADGLAYGRIAVLLRSNREALQVKAALDRARVPAVIAADVDVLASEEADELVRLAAAIAMPGDAWAVRSAMATRLWGASASEIAAMLRADGESQWTLLTDRFSDAREQWRTRGVAAAIGELLAERQGLERLLALPDGERRLTNVRHVVELVHDAWATEGVAPEEFGAWVAREQTVPNTPGRRELRLETDSEAVQVLTVHKAKGLQFDVVFCPALWQAYEGRKGPLGVHVAAVREEDGAILDLGSHRSTDRLLRQQRASDAEALRLAYVALTRAVHRCYVGWGAIGSGETASTRSPIGYLLRTGEAVASREVVVALAERSGGTMAVRDVAAKLQPMVAPDEGGATPMVTEPLSLQLAARQLDTWRPTSFTGMVADAHSEESRDVADPLVVASLASDAAVASGFRAFPAGRQAGIALHEVFESVDFSQVREARTRATVRRSLARHGLLDGVAAPDQRIDDVLQMVTTVSAATIPGAGFSLADVPVLATLREWRFDLSVASPSLRRIADVLAAHGSAHAQVYAPLLRTLKDSAMSGYMSGVIDLAVEHEGRWWLLDWKSNQLGHADQDYLSDALSAAMMQAHYTLQYHMYLLALHRHLTVRQPSYDAARHWGGVAYVFLRGVTGVGTGGWFRDTPTPRLLHALDAAMGTRR